MVAALADPACTNVCLYLWDLFGLGKDGSSAAINRAGLERFPGVWQQCVEQLDFSLVAQTSLARSGDYAHIQRVLAHVPVRHRSRYHYNTMYLALVCHMPTVRRWVVDAWRDLYGNDAFIPKRGILHALHFNGDEDLIRDFELDFPDDRYDLSVLDCGYDYHVDFALSGANYPIWMRLGGNTLLTDSAFRNIWIIDELAKTAVCRGWIPDRKYADFFRRMAAESPTFHAFVRRVLPHDNFAILLTWFHDRPQLVAFLKQLAQCIRAGSEHVTFESDEEPAVEWYAQLPRRRAMQRRKM